MFWLSKQPKWAQARELSISTRSFGVGYGSALVEGEEDDGDGDPQHKVKFLPSHDRSTSLWYRGHYLRLSRSEVPDGPYTKDVLKVRLVPIHSLCSPSILIRCGARVLARDHKIINRLLLDAKSVWKAAKEGSIFIYSSNVKNEWQFVASRPKRPLSSIILDVGIKEKILDDAKDFFNSKKWYAERGIPFRRGYLLVRLVESEGALYRD